MLRRPPRSTRTDTLFPYTALFRSKKVLVSAPASGADITVVYGINHDQMKKSHTVVSNASCTTNCLVPVAHVLEQTVGIKHGFMTTVHSYTVDQPVVDTLPKDPRRARHAALSMTPTSEDGRVGNEDVRTGRTRRKP